jgi:hypothetical protein
MTPTPTTVASRLAALGMILAALLLALAVRPPVSLAQDPCAAPVTNEVACENSKPGTPSVDWEVNKEGAAELQGFPTQMSVNKGDTIDFKIRSTSGAYKLDILRLGYYNGAGARKLEDDIVPTSVSSQSACMQEGTMGLIDCGNWSVSASWTVPTTAVSGVYIAHLVDDSTPSIESHIVFVVRDDSSDSDIVVQTSDQTWQAYNTYGGNSLYTCQTICPPGNPAGYKAAYAVSYNRPLLTEQDSSYSALFLGAEYAMIRFLEASAYDVSYISSIDTQTRGSLLLNHKLFMSSGHDEYWAGSQRENVEAARDAGVNLAFFSGNEMFWRTRFAPSMAGPTTANRTLVSYKDTHLSTQAERDPVEWTGTWRDPRSDPDDEILPENNLIGQSFVVNSGTRRIVVPAAYRQMRLWRNTGTGLAAGANMALAPDTLGYEWDVDADNGFRPKGLIRLSSTTETDLEVFTDFGSTTKLGGTATHNLTLYKAPSGALVFGAGTVQWSRGLDDYHPEGTVDNNMRQATVNLFADMGIQPATLLPGLVAASASTDVTPPSSTINSLPASVADGAQVTISGTASDAGGGRVAGIEVSTDGGTSWRPATSGTTSWSYTWTAHGHPSTTIRVRATDDSGNTETPGAGVSLDINCPCSLWGVNTAPESSHADGGDVLPVEVGVKFEADSFGTISGIRFYKSAANTGTHIGSLWTSDGTRLAQATFTSETASGWQTVTFDTPVPVQKDTPYVASYHAPNGHYAATPDYFYRAPSPGPVGGGSLHSPPLHAIEWTPTTGNGVFAYGPSSSFPANSSGTATNYWVDVVYSPTPIPGQVTNVTATSGGLTSANVTWNAPATGGVVTSYRITPYIGSTPQTPKVINGTPPLTSTTVTGLTNGQTYTFRVEAINPNGDGLISAPSNAVTPLVPVSPAAPTGVSAQGASQSVRVTWMVPGSDGDSPITGYTVTPYIGGVAQTPVPAGPSATSVTVPDLTNGTAYTFRVTATNAVGSSPASAASNAATPQATIFDLATPAVPDSGDTNSAELGVKFTADYNGSITGIRFYKSAANIGTHTGSLWTAGGTRLAQATFTNETATGWQTVTFATPVAITAGTTYVASYFAPFGRYSGTVLALDGGVDNGPLHALASSTSANGVYRYTTSSALPTSTYGASNYWVDVTYAVPQPGTVTNVAAVEGGLTTANVSWTAPASGGPVTRYKITPYVGSTAQTPRFITGTPPGTQTTITGLTTGTTYTFRVQALNANGAGPESAASNAVTPQSAVVPAPPTGVHATPATSSARVTWTPSASDGDSPITSQIVTPYDGPTAQTPVNVSAGATSATITGLDNGTAYTFRVRSVNAVGNSPSSVASNPVTPRSTIFDFATPSLIESSDTGAVELGVKFRSDEAGSITGIRFHKAAGNTGTHTGSLWTASGTRLAQATFTNETASGWQTVLFSSPVDIAANTTYVASYYAPKGRYSVTPGGLTNAATNAPLQALGNGTSPNGVFAYGSSSLFPANSFNASNYAVDVLFAPAPAPGEATSVTATAGQASASVSWTAPTTGGPVTSYEVVPYIGSTAQTSKTITGNPPATNTTVTGLTAGTSYTFRVIARNSGGPSPESAPSNAVVPTAPVAPSAPTSVAAEADSTSAIVTWSAPASDGGAEITQYTVTPYDGSTALTPVNADGSARRTRVTGLTDMTTYTFRITATTSVGASPEAVTAAVTPKHSLFELSTPTTVDGGDANSVVAGMKFTAGVDGAVTGVRFYKSAANTGTHVGALWSATGTLLRDATFSGETASGWQTVTFSSPVAVTAGTTYVVSYLAPNGHYAVTGGAFAAGPFSNPPLEALHTAQSPNGVYRYSATSAFPTSSFNSANYWVDVLFAPGS